MSDQSELNHIIKIMKPTWDHYVDQIFIKDINRRYQYINQKYLDDTGLNEHDILGKNGFEIFKPVDNKSNNKLNNADLKVLVHGKKMDYETTFVLKGKTFHSRTVKTPIFGASGNIIGIYGTSKNINEEVNTRNQLQQNLSLLETLMDTVPYPIFIKDLESRYIKINNAFAYENRTDKNYILFKNDIELFGEDLGQFLVDKDKLVLSTGDRHFYLTSLNSHNYMTIKEPLRDEDDNIVGIVGIVNPFVNISDIQEKIINHQKIESLSTLTGGIAHDLNNILTAVMGLSSVMLLDEEETKDRKQMSQTIYNASVQASSLINKLLAFSKETHGEFKTVDFKKQILNVISLVSGNLPSHVDLTTNLSDEEILIEVDETQISQLILNLLMNAIEAIEHREESEENNSIEIKLAVVKIKSIESNIYSLVPDDSKPGTYVLLEVMDTGVGIPKELIGNIFDPYFTTKENGSGLGLPVIYGVISTHRGLLQVDSEINKGTSFKIYLPMDR